VIANRGKATGRPAWVDDGHMWAQCCRCVWAT